MWTAHRYHALADRLYAEVAPVPVRAPTLVALDEALAAELGLEPAWLRSPEGVAALAGNAVLPGTRPVALAYAGHQFGQFVPSLGDGRAVLLGEVAATDGRRREIQLKGSGRTPFSRGGDGRAALGPMLREFVISAAMAGLGIPTTRSLAVIATGEPVRRETMLPGAIVVRVAESHVRVGTFQYFAARGDREALALLVDDVVARSYPELAAATGPERAAALLDAACARQAKLVASWMGVGFVHGVMNTDNVALAGETIDYGPCAFLDAYDPATVFSSIDRTGRYAFANQPHMAGWAMARLAEALLPLLADDRDRAVAIAQAAIDRMAAASTRAYDAVMAAKIGLAADDPAARDLVTRLLAAMAATAADHTATFTALTDATADPAAAPALAARLSSPELAAWLDDHRAAVAAGEGGAAAAAARMRAANPRFVPRNHRVEAALAAAAEDDLGPLGDLLAVVRRPFDEHPALSALAEPPTPGGGIYRTFCGT